MAGRGPAPKPADKRARTNADVVPLRVVVAVPSAQPELPVRFRAVADSDAPFSEVVDWPSATVEWWQMWGRSPLAASFTETDWAELLLAAFLHADFMEGNYKVAGELRLRTAKFGATPEDRLRLRIQFADVQEAEARVERRASSAGRMSGVRPVGA